MHSAAASRTPPSASSRRGATLAAVVAISLNRACSPTVFVFNTGWGGEASVGAASVFASALASVLTSVSASALTSALTAASPSAAVSAPPTDAFPAGTTAPPITPCSSVHSDVSALHVTSRKHASLALRFGSSKCIAPTQSTLRAFVSVAVAATRTRPHRSVSSAAIASLGVVVRRGTWWWSGTSPPART